MQKNVILEEQSDIREFVEYDTDKSAIAKICVLSTAPNSHGLIIPEEVLRRDIGSIRGNFLVADIKNGDATTHTPSETPVGYFIPNEPIEFEEVETPNGKVVKAWAYAVLSKKYAKSAYEMFVNDNHRATSIEMSIETDESNENLVTRLSAYGSTILGHGVAPSDKNAEISLVRFAEEANELFEKRKTKEGNANMAEKKTYKVDESKEAMSEKPWGEVDKKSLRDAVMDAENRDSLVYKVYLRVEDGWEDAPSEKLGYPVMELDGDTFKYNRYGLSSALAYARQEDDKDIIAKVEKLYKKLDIDDGKEDDTKMAKDKEEKMDEIEGRKAWGTVIRKVKDHEGEGVYVDSIEDDHIIYTKGDVRYRVNAEIKVDEDDKSVDAKIDWGTQKKDADQKMADDKHEDENDEKHDDKPNFEEKCDKLTADIEERDHIIMDKDKELEELRKFKEDTLGAKRDEAVRAVMASVKGYLDETKYKELMDEGMACKFEDVDAWSNKVKAMSFDCSHMSRKPKTEIFSFSAPISFERKGDTAMERLKMQYGE